MREGWGHGSEFRRAASKKMMEYRMSSNIVTDFEMKKIVSKRKAVDEAKNLGFHCSEGLYVWSSLYMRSILHRRKDKAFVHGQHLGG